MRARHVPAIVLAAFASAASARVAPELERGFRPEMLYHFNGADTVSLFNGNLNVAIPLASYSVARDVSYDFVLRYSGNQWQPMNMCAQIGEPDPENCPKWNFDQIDGGAGLGWTLSFGKLMPDNISTHEPDGTPPGYVSAKSPITYTSPDGATHTFFETLHDPKCTATVQSNCDELTADVYYTRDGTYLRARRSGTAWILEFPNGRRERYEPVQNYGLVLTYIYGATSSLDDAGKPATNWVKFEYPLQNEFTWMRNWSITDSHGRAHAVTFREGVTVATGIVDRIQLAAPGSTTATYNLVYDSTGTVDGPPTNVVKPRNTHPTFAPTAAANLLARIILPDDTSWAFTYDIVSLDWPGALIRAKLPTGGRIAWDYQSYTHLAPHTLHGYMPGVSERCLRRDDNPCTTASPGPQDQYTRYEASPGLVRMDVKAYVPVPNITQWRPDSFVRNHYQGTTAPLVGVPSSGTTDEKGRFLISETFDCDPALNTCDATPLRRSYVKYEWDALVGTCLNDYPCAGDRNRRASSERVEFTDDGGKFADITRTDFDGLGHFRSVLADGWTQMGLARTTFTNYNADVLSSGQSVGTYSMTEQGGRADGYTMLPASAPWILDTYTVAEVTQGTSMSFTRACFDHATGFLLRSRKQLSNAPDAHDLLQVFTAHSSGYNATEKYFGGQKQSLGLLDAPCTIGLPGDDTYSFSKTNTYQYGVLKTSKFDGVSSYLANHAEVDLNTGLVLKSRDASDAETVYEYDSQRRLTKVSPPDVTSTVYAYTPAAGGSTAHVTATTGTGSASIQQRWDFDAFGRVEYEKRLQPSGDWSTRRTMYDALGRIARQSETENASGATYGLETVFSAYDPFGRVGTVTAPDGTATTFAYVGDRVAERTFSVAKSGGDANVTVREERDRHGRLVEVTEDAGGAAVAASYTYDESDRLEGVSISAPGVTAQTRTFDYDGRGILLSETHPESGTTSYTYDALGNVVEKTNAAGTVLTHVYDPAGRLLEVQEGNNLIKQFAYDRANGTQSPIDRSMGKLNWARRYNTSAELGTVEVTETHEYRGRGGRLSKKTTEVRRPLSNNPEITTFEDSYTYNTLGQLESIAYPLCTGGPCTAMAAPSRTVTNTWTHGAITDVPSYTTPSAGSSAGITYHPSGVIATIQHRNASGTAGPKLTQTLSSARLGSISVSSYCENLTVSAPSPQPRSVVYNEPAGLSVTATNATTFQWYRVSGETAILLASQTTSQLTVPVTATTTYFVRVGNGSCTVDSERATVTICTQPPATITAPATMLASTTAQASVTNTPGATYAWTVTGGTITAGAGTNQITFRAGCSGFVSIDVVVTKDNCPATDTHYVAVTPPTATVSGSTTILQGEAANVSVHVTGVGKWTLTWSDGATQEILPPATSGTHNVTPAATTTYTVTTIKDVNQCVGTASGSAVIVVRPPAPFGVQATAAGTTSVQVSWSFGGTSADEFRIYRSGVLAGTVGGAIGTFTDAAASANTAYVYTVVAVKAGVLSDPSAGDLATTVIFEDDPVVQFSTRARAVHVTQLRTAANAVRAATGGLSQTSFPPMGAVVTAADIEAIRMALAPARALLNQPAAVYTRTVTAGMMIQAIDVNETRSAVR